MTGRTRERPGVTPTGSARTLDFDYAERVDTYLERAQAADDPAEKDFHLKHARQLLTACREE
jgi:hypothetical protein